MKNKPKDGGRYQREVKPLKDAATKIARHVEHVMALPRGCVRICLTALSDDQRERVLNRAASVRRK